MWVLCNVGGRSESETRQSNKTEHSNNYKQLEANSIHVTKAEARANVCSSVVCSLIFALGVSNVALFVWTLHLQQQLDHIHTVLAKQDQQVRAKNILRFTTVIIHACYSISDTCFVLYSKYSNHKKSGVLEIVY